MVITFPDMSSASFESANSRKECCRRNHNTPCRDACLLHQHFTEPAPERQVLGRHAASSVFALE